MASQGSAPAKTKKAADWRPPKKRGQKDGGKAASRQRTQAFARDVHSTSLTHAASLRDFSRFCPSPKQKRPPIGGLQGAEDGAARLLAVQAIGLHMTSPSPPERGRSQARTGDVPPTRASADGFSKVCPCQNKKGRRLATFLFWQGQKDSNPRPMVLETSTLPTELYPCATRVIIPYFARFCKPFYKKSLSVYK